MFIDTHCHLDMLEKEGVSIADAISHARKVKVEAIVVNGVNPSHNREILELAKKFDEIKPALGMYPLDALKLTDLVIEEEIEFIVKNKKKIYAIGEIGLDLKDEELNDSFEKQKIIFEKFVRLGMKLNKPVIVHSRKAELQTIELLEKIGAKKVIMHCFSGKMKLVDRIVKNGWFLSIPANIKYSEQFQDVVKRVPIENLFCETDSPYLHPDKKWPNESANVLESYKKIAEIKGLKLKEVEKKIEENYKNVFG
ncbi:TatD family deoxyribonuclease [Candidatus Pacearchaeota archaeon]|nr:TatD family deoxyribonuclease [Candidatus Pacearchaeota archaeon]